MCLTPTSGGATNATSATPQFRSAYNTPQEATPAPEAPQSAPFKSAYNTPPVQPQAQAAAPATAPYANAYTAKQPASVSDVFKQTAPQSQGSGRVVN